MDINQKCINELKALSAEIVSNANSGHTGSALGASSIIFALFKDHLMFNPENPKFLNRDRLVFSAGHASALYYAVLHMFGYDISSSDLKNFRKFGSKTPGHPETHVTPGIEVSTGPLGQGIANAVGLAIAESMLEAKLKIINQNLINNYTYCYAGDGCMMEGVALEACSLAGNLELNKLILLYDDNNITIDGTRELTNNENIEKKFKAMNWNVINVKNGNDYLSCTKAIKHAKKSQKPTIIIFKTTIGLGTMIEGTPKVHSYPLSSEELATFKKSLNITSSFELSQDVKKYCYKTISKNLLKYDKWNNYLITLKENKNSYKIFKKATESSKINFDNLLSKLKITDNLAGRKISNMILNNIAKSEPNLIGGTADVSASTLSFIENGGDFSAKNRLGRNIHFGIREHAMGAICNGIALYNNQPVFNSTFLAFSNYMIPALRMSALMKTPTLNIFTHDSLNVGQDGPTHQPIEQLAMLRSIIGLQTFRPANEVETISAYKYFFDTKLPTSIVFSKTNLKKYDNITLENVSKGGYIIYENSTSPDVIIIATGTEVELAMNITKHLEKTAIRIVSMPCENIFYQQENSYKNKVLSNSKLRVIIEASNDNIWHKYLRKDDLLVGVTKYFGSGNGAEIYKTAGFDEKIIAKAILNKLNKN